MIERIAENVLIFIFGMIIMPTILYYTDPDVTKFLFVSFTMVLVLDTVHAAITLE